VLIEGEHINKTPPLTFIFRGTTLFTRNEPNFQIKVHLLLQVFHEYNKLFGSVIKIIKSLRFFKFLFIPEGGSHVDQRLDGQGRSDH
jgi:hypothetical protein